MKPGAGKGAEAGAGMGTYADATAFGAGADAVAGRRRAAFGAGADAGLVRALRAGRVALVATDTVYGLAAVPSAAAVGEICALKGRPADQAIAWLVPDAAAASRLWTPGLSRAARNLAAGLWPGALTLVAQASPAARATGACAADGTLALRVPDDDALRALMRELDSPLACTSANPHGRPAPARLGDVDRAFLSLPHAASLPAACPRAVPSTIVDCTGKRPRIVRRGAVPQDAIMRTAGDARLVPRRGRGASFAAGEDEREGAEHV